jgi:hypothetical protein
MDGVGLNHDRCFQKTAAVVTMSKSSCLLL